MRPVQRSTLRSQIAGITSMMFCGIAMAKYCRPNLSKTSNERVGAFFRVIAYLAEIFVFIYIGLAVFTDERARKVGRTWTFMVGGLAALALSRLLNIYPLTSLCNVLTPEENRHIPRTHKDMLWFSGLRGAMAFALATQNAVEQSQSGEKVDRDSADVILTATFFMVRNGSAGSAHVQNTCGKCLHPLSNMVPGL